MPASAYLAATRYKLDDTRPYLYKTNDYGKTWIPITNGIPDGEFTRVDSGRSKPARLALCRYGNRLVCLISTMAKTGNAMGGNLPVCPIYDLVIKDCDLVSRDPRALVLDPR